MFLVFKGLKTDSRHEVKQKDQASVNRSLINTLHLLPSITRRKKRSHLSHNHHRPPATTTSLKLLYACMYSVP